MLGVGAVGDGGKFGGVGAPGSGGLSGGGGGEGGEGGVGGNNGDGGWFGGGRRSRSGSFCTSQTATSVGTSTITNRKSQNCHPTLHFFLFGLVVFLCPCLLINGGEVSWSSWSYFTPVMVSKVSSMNASITVVDKSCQMLLHLENTRRISSTLLKTATPNRFFSLVFKTTRT